MAEVKTVAPRRGAKKKVEEPIEEKTVAVEDLLEPEKPSAEPVAESEEDENEAKADVSEDVIATDDDNPLKGLMFEEDDAEAAAEEEEKEVEQIQEKVSRAKAKATKSKNAKQTLAPRQLKSATKKEKKELYNDEYVIPLNDDLAYETEGEKKKRAYEELLASYKAGKILTGTVIGMTEIDGHPSALVNYKDIFTVKIPFEFFAQLRPSDQSIIAKGGTQADKHKRFLINQRLMSEIDFRVRMIDEAEEVYIGDRVSAMAKIKKHWYFETDRATGEHFLNRGSKVEARVVYASTVRMIVEVRGMEFPLDAAAISTRYIPDISKEFHAGMTVPVMFTKLERQNTAGGTTVACKVSVKEAMPDPRLRYLKTYKVNSVVVGDVTGIEEYGIYVRLEGTEGKMDALCQFTPAYRELPKIGDKIILIITQIDEENMRIFGRPLRTLVHKQ